MSRIRGFIACMALLAGSVQAADTRLYAGIGGGTARNFFNVSDFTQNTPGESNLQTDRDNGAKGFAGYQFHRHWAVEAGYTRLGTFVYENIAAGGAGTITNDYGVKGPTLSLVLRAPINDKFALFGRAGAFRAHVRRSVEQSSGVFAATITPGTVNVDTKTTPLLGFGAQYDFTSAFAGRVEYEDYGTVGDESTGRAKARMTSVSLIFQF